jgi:hypothetical protein
MKSAKNGACRGRALPALRSSQNFLRAAAFTSRIGPDNDVNVARVIPANPSHQPRIRIAYFVFAQLTRDGV